VGGCWTHIGSAQSVVAYAFIRREVDDAYTPMQWIREMTPTVVEMMAAVTLLLYLESSLREWLG
jgi:di/tricarboxylate transporter